jgi:hypothetical protein
MDRTLTDNARKAWLECLKRVEGRCMYDRDFLSSATVCEKSPGTDGTGGGCEASSVF